MVGRNLGLERKHVNAIYCCYNKTVNSEYMHFNFLTNEWIPTWIRICCPFRMILKYMQKSYLNLSSKFLHYHYANISALYCRWMTSSLALYLFAPAHTVFSFDFEGNKRDSHEILSFWIELKRSYSQPTQKIFLEIILTLPIFFWIFLVMQLRWTFPHWAVVGWL